MLPYKTKDHAHHKNKINILASNPKVENKSKLRNAALI